MITETNTTEQQQIKTAEQESGQPDNSMPALKMKTRSMARATRSSAATCTSNPEEPTIDEAEKNPQIDVVVPPFEVEEVSGGAATAETQTEAHVEPDVPCETGQAAEEPIAQPDEQPAAVQEEMPAEAEPQPIDPPVTEEEVKIPSVTSSKRVSKKRDFSEISKEDIAEAIQESKPSTKKSKRLNDGTHVEVVVSEPLDDSQPEKTEANPAVMATKETETADSAKAEENVQQIDEQVQSLNVENAGAAEKSNGEEQDPPVVKPADDVQPAEAKQLADLVKDGGDAETDPVAAQKEPEQQQAEAEVDAPAQATSEGI